MVPGLSITALKRKFKMNGEICNGKKDNNMQRF